jgi:hypothetical protein
MCGGKKKSAPPAPQVLPPAPPPPGYALDAGGILRDGVASGQPGAVQSETQPASFGAELGTASTGGV